MKRKESITSGAESIAEQIATSDWVATQLCLSLQLLASPAQDQVDHFPPNVAIISELSADYEHFAACISTYWELSHDQAVHLKALQHFFQKLDCPETNDFWTVQALFSFHWAVEVPLPELGSVGWKQLKRQGVENTTFSTAMRFLCLRIEYFPLSSRQCMLQSPAQCQFA